MAAKYDDKFKKEVVNFVAGHNKKNGRGGQTAAKKKYGINPITIAAWLDKAGVKTPGKKRGAKGAGTKIKKGKGAKKGSSDATVLKRMLSIQEEIDQLQSEFDALKKQL